jgi:hypothetical protein
MMLNILKPCLLRIYTRLNVSLFYSRLQSFIRIFFLSYDTMVDHSTITDLIVVLVYDLFSDQSKYNLSDIITSHLIDTYQ